MQIIPEGLPGADNLLLFDNQGEAGYPAVTLKVLSGSRMLEIDPAKQRIVWEYTGTDNDRPQWTFYSSFISSARRLPNGNTLIDEGMNGHLFQVTRTGEIVWEFVSPYFGPASLGPAGKKLLTNWVYRAQPLPYDWAPPATPHRRARRHLVELNTMSGTDWVRGWRIRRAARQYACNARTAHRNTTAPGRSERASASSA